MTMILTFGMLLLHLPEFSHCKHEILNNIKVQCYYIEEYIPVITEYCISHTHKI